MAFVRFLNALFDHGRVSVTDPRLPIGEELRDAEQLLVDVERTLRRELPGSPPALSVEHARWGAVTFYRASQLLVYRDWGSDAVAAALKQPCGEIEESATHYSVDLTYRFLPDLVRMARAAAHDDPLVHELMHWAARFPLSSVGLEIAGDLNVEPIVQHPSLLAMYVDRIMVAQDTSRLNDARVREAVAGALGIHGRLAPKLFSTLRETTGTEVRR
jgi:hypothetical protein